MFFKNSKVIQQKPIDMGGIPEVLKDFITVTRTDEEEGMYFVDWIKSNNLRVMTTNRVSNGNGWDSYYTEIEDNEGSIPLLVSCGRIQKHAVLLGSNSLKHSICLAANRLRGNKVVFVKKENIQHLSSSTPFVGFRGYPLAENIHLLVNNGDAMFVPHFYLSNGKVDIETES